MFDHPVIFIVISWGTGVRATQFLLCPNLFAFGVFIEIDAQK